MDDRPIDKLISRLSTCRNVGDHQWTACCPAHDDTNPSLSIKEVDDGKVLLHCHAGCAIEEILEAMDLELRDLFPPSSSGGRPRPSGSRGSSRGVTRGSGRRPGAKSDKVFPSAEDAIAGYAKFGKPSSTWEYRSPLGELVAVAVRWDRPGGKEIRYVSRREDGWRQGPPQAPRPLYGLDGIGDADRIYVVEGEKSVDRLCRLGVRAVTSPGGAMAAAKADWTALEVTEVVILPDADDPGLGYAEDVAELLRARGIAVAVVPLPGLQDQSGDDIVEWIEKKHGGDESAAAAELDRLADQALVKAASCRLDPRRQTQVLVESDFKPFPLHALPEPISTYVEHGGSAIGCDPSFIALPMLAALASAIGNSRCLFLKRTWLEPSIVWSVIVGEPGTAKSPALEYAVRPVRRKQEQMMKDYDERLKAWEAAYALWEVKNAAWKKQALKGESPGEPPVAPDRPVCPRTWTDDATTEAVVSILSENPRGLLMVRDELSGWFNFDQYKNGKGGGDVAKWLEFYGGRSLIVDRKTSGVEHVERASVSIAGGIQPDTLRRVLSPQYRGNGLASRLLYAMPPRQPRKWTEDDVDEQLENRVGDLFGKLYALAPASDSSPIPITMNAGAKAMWIKFMNDHGQAQLHQSNDMALAWPKLEGYAARIALVIHLTRVAAGDEGVKDPDVVDEHSLASALEIVRWCAREAERVYRMISGSEPDRARSKLVDWIKGRGGSVTVRDVTKGYRGCKRDNDTAREALEKLVSAGLGFWDRGTQGKQGGRPAERFRIHDDVPVPETQPDGFGSGGFGDGDNQGCSSSASS